MTTDTSMQRVLPQLQMSRGFSFGFGFCLVLLLGFWFLVRGSKPNPKPKTQSCHHLHEPVEMMSAHMAFSRDVVDRPRGHLGDGHHRRMRLHEWSADAADADTAIRGRTAAAGIRRASPPPDVEFADGLSRRRGGRHRAVEHPSFQATLVDSEPRARIGRKRAPESIFAALPARAQAAGVRCSIRSTRGFNGSRIAAARLNTGDWRASRGTRSRSSRRSDGAFRRDHRRPAFDPRDRQELTRRRRHRRHASGPATSAT